MALGNALGSILVVEDDIACAKILAEVLKVHGYAAVVTANGQEALDALESGLVPLAILLDLVMPVMSGREFLEFRNRDERLLKIPVVVFSASIDLSALGMSSKAWGARVTVLSKPVEMNRLMIAIEQSVAAD